MPRSSLLVDWPIGTVLSEETVLHEGARGAVLHVPGAFRIDLRPSQDTVTISIRNLSPVQLRPMRPERERTVVVNGKPVASSAGEATKRHDVRFDLGDDLEVRAVMALDRSHGPGIIRVFAQALIVSLNPAAVART